MSLSLIKSLQAATEALGPEHGLAVREARAALRDIYVNCHEKVTGTTRLNSHHLSDMDLLDAIVERWIVELEGNIRMKEMVHSAMEEGLGTGPSGSR